MTRVTRPTTPKNFVKSLLKHDTVPLAKCFGETEIQGNICTREAMPQQNTTQPEELKPSASHRSTTDNVKPISSLCSKTSHHESLALHLKRTRIVPQVPKRPCSRGSSPSVLCTNRVEKSSTNRAEKSAHQAENYGHATLSVGTALRGTHDEAPSDTERMLKIPYLNADKSGMAVLSFLTSTSGNQSNDRN